MLQSVRENMAKNTLRDRVWNRALILATRGDHFEVKHIRNYILSDEGSDRTIRDVLNTMVENEWLEKESRQSHEWRQGPKLKHMTACERCGFGSKPEGVDACVNCGVVTLHHHLTEGPNPICTECEDMLLGNGVDYDEFRAK